MQFRVFWGTLLRRWQLLLVALAVTAAATVLVVNKVGPTFEAKGAVLLFPPARTVQGAKVQTEGNPYLLLEELDQARDVVIRAVLSKTTYEDLCAQQGDAAYEAMRRQLCRRDPIVTYEVTPDYTSSTPIILITVDAKSPDVAVTGLHTLMDRVPKALVDLQAGLNLGASATITSVRLTADRTPDVVYKHQIRAGIVAGAGTLALSLLMIGLFDGLVAVRRRREELAGHAAQADESANSEKPAGLKPVPAEEANDEQSLVAAPLADEAAAAAAEQPMVATDNAAVSEAEQSETEQHVVEPAEQPLVATDNAAVSEAEQSETEQHVVEPAEQPLVATDNAAVSEAEQSETEQHVVEPAEQPQVATDNAAESEAEEPEAGEAVAEWPVAEWPVPMWAVAEELDGAQSGHEESGEKHRDVTRLPERSQPSERTNTITASA